MFFNVRILHWCYINDTKRRVSKRKSEIQEGGFQNSVAQISAYTHDRNVIPTAALCFWGQVTRIDYWEYCPMYGYVVNQRWKAINRT